MPMAQVLDSAANVSPPPTPAASHLSFGAATLPRMLVSTIEPATRRTWRSRSQRCAPRLTAKPFASQAVIPPSRMCTLHRPALRSVSSACAARLPGATHQHDLVVEVLDDLVAVLAQQIQRNVVGPGDVGGLELARGSHVENPRRHSRTEALAEVLRIDGGGSGHGDQGPSGWAGGDQSL